MRIKTLVWAMLLACAFTFTGHHALAGDPQGNRGFEAPELAPKAPAREGVRIPEQMDTAQCLPSIKGDTVVENDIVSVASGYGFEEALLGEWKGGWRMPSKGIGGTINLFLTHTGVEKVSDKDGNKRVVYGYNTIKQVGTRDGCGEGGAVRFPKDKPYDWTYLGSGVLGKTAALHYYLSLDRDPLTLRRVVHSDGEVDYYLVSETYFGYNLSEGPWRTIITLRTASETMDEALETIYQIIHPDELLSEQSPTVNEGQVSEAN